MGPWAKTNNPPPPPLIHHMCTTCSYFVSLSEFKSFFLNLQINYDCKVLLFKCNYGGQEERCFPKAFCYNTSILILYTPPHMQKNNNWALNKTL